jgi:hypothetical protein
MLPWFFAAALYQLYRDKTNPTLTMDQAKNHSSAKQSATPHTANRYGTL